MTLPDLHTKGSEGVFMKSNGIRFVSFSLIFIIVLSLLSNIYNDGRNAGYTQFYNEPRNSFDVLIFGNSIHRDMWSPAVFWNETGIKAYNLSAHASPSNAQYYWLKEALKYQSPSVVILYGRWFFIENDNDNEEAEYRLRIAMDSMRFSRNKIEAITDIVSNSGKQHAIDYLFSVFRFHARKVLTPDDFVLSRDSQRNLSMRYPSRGKSEVNIEKHVLPTEFHNEDHNPKFTINSIYLQKAIDLCREHGIEVILTVPPDNRIENWSINMHRTLQEYADSQGVTLLDFYYGEPCAAVNFSGETDFRDINHLNIGGATKASRYMAHYLSTHFGLPDRRAENHDAHWDDVLKAYNDLYQEYEDALNAESSAENDRYEGEREN